MRLVLLESPYSGLTTEDVEDNVAYARRAVADCLSRGESPMASHLLLTQSGVLDDTVPEQRALGMRAGWAWLAVVDAVVVYTDRGISAGMLAGLAEVKAAYSHLPVEYREIGEGL